MIPEQESPVTVTRAAQNHSGGAAIPARSSSPGWPPARGEKHANRGIWVPAPQ